MNEDVKLPTGARRRIAVVADGGDALVRERLPLLRTIAAAGHQLHCLLGRCSEKAAAELAALGAEVASVDLGPPRTRVYADRGVFEAVSARLRQWRPYAVLAIGLKPMVAAGLAARRTEDARIVMLAQSLAQSLAPSLAPLGADGHERPGLATRWLLRRALRPAHALVVHDPSVIERLRALSVLPGRLPVTVLPGAGVDLSAWQPLPMPDLAQGVVFALSARADRPSDLTEIVEAIRFLRAQTPKAQFVLWSQPASPPVTAAAVDATATLPEGLHAVEVSGDGRAVMARCHVLVQVCAAEGIAHEIAEALACGRPVVALDIARNRVAVDERVNGVLVPPHDPAALARAMASYLRRPEQLAWMGRASRSKAERFFDANAMSRQLLELMGLTEQK
jgi:hypothetical protein